MEHKQTLKKITGVEFESKSEFAVCLIKGVLGSAMLFGYVIFGTILLEGLARCLP